jgi:hypothetical protein
MFQTLELGLKPVTTYEIDDRFFEEFGLTSEAIQVMEPTVATGRRQKPVPK